MEMIGAGLGHGKNQKGAIVNIAGHTVIQLTLASCCRFIAVGECPLLARLDRGPLMLTTLKVAYPDPLTYGARYDPRVDA